MTVDKKTTSLWIKNHATVNKSNIQMDESIQTYKSRSRSSKVGLEIVEKLGFSHVLEQDLDG